MKLNEVKPDSANYRLRVEYMKQDSKPRKCKCGFIGPVLDPEDISEGFRVTTSSTQKLYVSKKCLRLKVLILCHVVLICEDCM